jgi:transposase
MENHFDRLLAGIDWATETHQICIIDERGEVVDERTVQHSGPAVSEFIDWLLSLCGGEVSRIVIGIEVPRGALVEMLLERGLAVYALNPKQLDRFRDRFFPAGSKDDRRDAYVIATSLRTDPRCFHLVRADDPAILRLRDLSRLEDELKHSFHRHCCQLREQLQRYYPQILKLSPSADEAWIWSLLEIAPAPQRGAKLTKGRIEKLLKRHRIRRLDAQQTLDILRQPGFSLVPGTIEAASEHALVLLPHLRLLHAQRVELGQKMDTLLQQMSNEDNCQPKEGQHRDSEIILSLPGVGRVVAATMLAEASQALRQRNYHALRAYSGVAPVTRKSGKKCTISMRQSCNERLRNAMHYWSQSSVQQDPVSAEHYQQLRRSGHKHSRALRGVADRLLAVLIAMLKAGELHDPHRRLASKRATLSSNSAEDRAPQGCDLSADGAADTPEVLSTSGPGPLKRVSSVCVKALNPGVAGAKPPTLSA